ncbi:MAG: CpsD/CapB family tyrosine-protein kinase [Candidatus Krumholzibacteria bacterium]|jgi:capsular exopolysaccharide synthesis family protein|nr:CpsD/CapB family tyrosine-protein kinase [Candidatus Krumholzibacteria bacterium]
MAKKRKHKSGGGLFDIESPMAIELRRIMIRLGRQIDLERKRALLITSAERGEGKSLFALHFALVLAYHLQKKILLLDADVRRPVQHTVFQVPLSPGFAELLAGTLPMKEAIRPTKVKNLGFLPAGLGGGNPSRLFSGDRVRDTVRELQEFYDIVLLDSPPVVPVSDPLHYLSAVDGVLYLVMAGQTHRDVTQRGVEILRSAGANILGVVANNLAEVLPNYYDRMYYGYCR